MKIDRPKGGQIYQNPVDRRREGGTNGYRGGWGKDIINGRGDQ